MSEILDNPVVEQVRSARRALARECDFDVQKMFDLLKKMQQEHPERVGCPSGTKAVAANRSPSAPG